MLKWININAPSYEKGQYDSNTPTLVMIWWKWTGQWLWMAHERKIKTLKKKEAERQIQRQKVQASDCDSSLSSSHRAT